MDKVSLASLPDDLVLDIVEHLDTARDVAHVSALTKHLRSLVRQDGWRTFVKTRFPSLEIATNGDTQWSTIADRATYLDRCWEKRGFWINVLHEKKQQPERFHRRVAGSQSVLFHTVLDARLSSSLQNDVLAAGVGENLMVRMKPVNGKPDTWHQIPGQAHGYKGGIGDVTAVSVIEDNEVPGVVVGRANGDIQILSGRDDFTSISRQLKGTDGPLRDNLSDMRKSPGQTAVSSLQWQPEANLLASGKGSTLMLYDLSASGDSGLTPIESYDFSKTSPGDEASFLRSTKFMSKDVVACALGASRNPLRWGQLTPTGIHFTNAADNPRPLDDAAKLTDVRMGEKTTVRAIEPVRGGNENLLLSTWDDGTYRLLDIRTPSPQDAVYRDRFQPYEAGSSLLVYGTERFVAGSNTSPDIRLFDFRYPKPYHHTSALPCTTQWPFPSQKDDHKMWRQGWAPDCQPQGCDPQAGLLCNWHGTSRRNYWRPDATLHIGGPTYDRIYCLAKSSDLSDTVYCGLRGAILEMNLHLTDDAKYDPGQRSVPTGWTMGRPGGKISLIETGVSLCQAKEWSLENRGVPELIVQQPRPQKQTESSDQVKRHRLDYAFHKAQDFEQVQA
ncbi:hypothetical protein FPOAC1_004537 [Fusarium poae]|uniref:F-box domain-containing protein n=1 Tax=Fusarium poae TaxID=36050 RepID=A0A1B8ASN2_FUSPO|nr:hypothetical protein FPOAC1_004537 [Fusarium poae]KAG8671293.1 hypothetical protein FPOAC1_004537 [Fusarium poae]OBS23545.1 hypothetical protein FPOA_04095 [Fusarium poae]